MQNRFFTGLLRICKRQQTNSIIFSAYSVLSIIFTYPVAFFVDKIPGYNYGDKFWYLWDLWWFKKALLSMSDPYFTPYIFYPTGVSLAFSEVSPFNALASVPLQLIFDLFAAYKILWISTFILSGYGMYALARYLTGSASAAFVAGLIFMFSPFRFAHALGHMAIISTQWIPLYVLFLIKTVKENKSLNPFLAALFLTFTALSSYYYLIYLLVFTGLYIIYGRWTDILALNKGTITKIFIIMGAAGLTILPFVYPMLKEMNNSASQYMYGHGFVEFSADLMGFFIPSILHPVFKSYVAPFYLNFTGDRSEYTVFAGYTVLALSLIAVARIKTKEIRFWSLSAAIFVVLCLGPILHVNGVISIPCDQYTIHVPLPYSLLMQVPIFSIMRAPARWDVMVMLSLGVLSAYGLTSIGNRCKNGCSRAVEKRIGVFILSGGFILFEFLHIPYPAASVKAPAFYQHLSMERDDFAVLEIPFWPIEKYPEYMYYQTIHEKKLVNGYVSRTPDYVVEFLHSRPFIRQLVRSSKSSLNDDILQQDEAEIARSILNYYNIRYIVVHKNRMTKEEFNFVQTLLRKSLKEEPLTYEEDYIDVYKINKEPMKTFMAFHSGWYDSEKWKGTPTRWIKDDATLLIYADENRTAQLSMNAYSFDRPRTLAVYASDHQMTNVAVPTRFTHFQMPIALNKGVNIIRFRVPEGCERPSDVKRIKKDSRCLGIAFQSITLN